MQKQLEIMLALQSQMNTTIHPNWAQQNYEWYRAAWIECGELVEHYGYKWWKKQTPDMPQVELEVIDIWHFILSMYLAKYAANGNQCAKDNGYIARQMTDELMDKYEYHKMSVVEAAEFVAEESLCTKFCSITAFWHLLHAVNMDYAELFRKYVGKNVLNQFRQANGYKAGTYTKQWGSKEDNEVLYAILQDTELCDDFYSVVYDKLEEQYRTLRT